MVRKMFAGLLAFGACAVACAGTVRTVTAPALTLDTRIGLVKVVEDAAALRLSTRWDGAPEGVLTVNGAEAARLGADAEADHVLDGLAPGEYVCQWTTDASTNLATFCVRGGASILPPDGAGVRTVTAAPVALDTRIGLYKVLPVSDRGVASAVCRLSTRWDGAESGTLTVNGEEVRALGVAEEADHRLDSLAPGEYVCRWMAGDATYLATFSVRGDGSTRPPRTGVEVTITGHTATYPYDGREKRAGGFDVAISDPFYTADDFVFTGCSNAVRTAVGTTAFGMSASDFANVNPDFADVVFHVVDGSVTVTPGAVVNPFDPDDPSAPPAPGALARADCVAVYDGEGHTISVAPLLNPALAADGAAVTYSPDPSRVPFAPENPVFTNAVSTCVWYRVASPNYAPFTTNALLEIRPRTVTLTSGTKLDFVYDGQPHAFPHFIKSGHDFVAGEGIVASNWATVTRVDEGEVANTFDYVAQEGTDLANYEIAVVTGRIAVVAASIPVGPSGAITAVGYTNVYDGAAHGVVVSASGLLTPTTVQYRAREADAWADVSPVFRDVCDTQVWYRVSAPNYVPVVGSVGIRITPRPVTLASKSATKVYDGMPLTAHEVVVGGDGFADGEGATYAFTGSQAVVGTSENSFTYTLNEKTAAGNYDITVENGSLTVTKASIGGGDGGGGEPGSGEVPDGGLSKFDAVFVYDGEGHTINTNALQAAFGAVMIGENTMEYAAGGSKAPATVSGAMNCIPPCFTNAGEYVVWYRVTNPNYEDFVHAAKVTITKRPVTLTSGTKLDFVYDGQPHAFPHFIKSGHDFVAGEGIVASNWATVTRVDEGEVANTFDYVAQEGTDLANYEIAVVTGRIAVVAASIPVGPSGAITAVGYTNVYDGAAHGIAVSARDLLTTPTYAYAATEDGEWSATSPVFTDVCDTQVWYRVSAPNYAPVVGSVGIRITPRPVMLASKSATKVYDGTPLTAHVVTVGGDGFVDGEGATYAFTGSQTVVGESENTFTYTLNGNTRAGNYEITVMNGSLTVTRAVIGGGGGEPGDGEIPDDGLSKFDVAVVYDGEGHTIDTNALQVAFGAALIGESVVEYAAGGSQFTATVSDAMNCVPPCFTNAGEYVVWYRVTNPNYADFVHAAKVTISKRPVTLTSKSDTKVYDGMPLTAHEVAVGGDGFADGEGAAYAFTGEQTAVGTSENTFTYTLNENTKVGNYEITTVNGALTVTKASIGGGEGGDEPGGGEVPDGGISKFDATAMYDGAGHTINTNALVAAFGAAMIGESVVEYAAGGSQFTATVSDAMNCVPPCFTNAGEYVVWYRVTNPNYADFVHAAKVTITKRPVTLTSKSATKVYDGTPLTAHVVTIGGDGFTDGEGAAYAFAGSQTVVGTSENTFTYTLNEKTAAGNYDITVENGTLTVTKASIGGEGGDEPGNGEVPDGGLSKFDVVFVYDGAGHTIDTNALVVAFGAAMIGENTVEYAAGGSQSPATVSDTMNCIPPCFTNAGEYVVWYRVTNPNYEDFVHRAKVTITPRLVTLTSGTKLDFVYDGQPHACPHFIKSGHDFVEGEGIVASNWATVTRVDEGEVANTFDYVAQEGTDLANYEIAVVTGRIAVVAASIPVGPSGAITAVGYTNVYDGAAHGVAVSVAGLLTTPTVQYRADEADAWADVSPAFGDVCDTQVWYRVSAPNYEPVVGAVGIRIAPRSVTLTSKSAAKVYDGTPLTAHVVTVGGDGFADGEGATYAFMGEQTVVGTSENAFTYTLNEKTAAGNYDITVENGSLTVTKASIGGGDGGGGEPGSGEVPDGGLSKFDTSAMYDGAGHTVDTNALVETFAGALVDAGEAKVYYGYASTGAATGVVQVDAWSEVPPVYTNAGEYVVWYRVMNPNYEDFTHRVRVTITRRRVTVTSADGTWAYDGTAHSNATVTVSGDGFVPGEGVACGGFATVTDEGARPNSFTHRLHVGTIAGNYEITAVFGTLTVTAAPPCRVVLDALGGRIGSACAVTQAVRTIYGALPEATRGGYRFAGWFLGVTNGAPEAVAGGDVLASGDHALFAKWICDPEAVPDPEAVYTWEALDADTARITGLRDPKQRLSRMVLPDRIGGRFVTEIAAGAFANTACGVEELWLPVFCTKIGDRAFLGIPSLRAITFAEARRWEDPPVHAAVSIGRYAFSGATSLARLVLVKEIASLGDYAFLNARNLTSVTILGRPTLGRQVFRSCGVDAGGVTVRLDPALADDAAYREALTSRMADAKIRTDAIVAGLRITVFELLETGTVRLVVSVERAVDWGVVDADTLLVRSGRTLPEMGDAARPLSAVRNGDGSVTLEVATPDGGGFFQAVITDE